MAKPIKETPILTGKDAQRFTEQINNVQKIDEKERQRMKLNYKKISSKINF